MFSLRSLIFAAALSAVSTAMAQTTVLSDSSIAHLMDIARDIDAAGADMAQKKATNNEIKSFAERIKRDHLAEKAAAIESLKQPSAKPEDNELSQSLSEVGAERSKELAGLSGPAYDKAYLENEIAYNVFVIGVLEVTALPSAKNPALKRLIEARLEIIEAHKRDAEVILSKLK